MQLLKIVFVLVIVFLIGRFALKSAHIENGTLFNKYVDFFLRLLFFIVLVVIAYGLINSILSGAF